MAPPMPNASAQSLRLDTSSGLRLPATKIPTSVKPFVSSSQRSSSIRRRILPVLSETSILTAAAPAFAAAIASLLISPRVPQTITRETSAGISLSNAFHASFELEWHITKLCGITSICGIPAGASAPLTPSIPPIHAERSTAAEIAGWTSPAQSE